MVSTGQRLFPPELKDRTTTELTGLFIRKIEQEIDDTGIKAGVIKAATVSAGVTMAEERVFESRRASQQSHRRSHETHSNSRLRGGIKQAEVFEAEGGESRNGVDRSQRRRHR